MSRDQIIGVLIFAGSLLAIALYAWLLFFVAPQLVMQATAFVLVSGVLLLVAWVGYTLATTPPPALIEELEKEAEVRGKGAE